MISMALASAPFAIRFDLSRHRDPEGHRLFFDDAEIERIRRNAGDPFLRPTFEAWRDVGADEVKKTITKVIDTGDLLYDWGAGIEAIYRQAMLTLLTDADKHRDLTMTGLETLRALPNWDYLRDGGTDVLGIMRGSKAVTATLFALEVLGSHVPQSLRTQLMRDVAEKGCAPCHLAIHQMNNPEEAKGWGVDEVQQKVNTWDMSRWPWILAVNNLRAIPTMGLGLGAIALEGHDQRAPEWRSSAVDSARRFLDLFEDDGSYFEGISYVDFAFRTLFLFFEADYRVHGDIDWVEEGNLRGVVNYVTALQNGKNDDGTPDIVNISDSRYTVFTCVPSWIANRSDNPLASWASQHFSRPGYFADFLWYRPARDGSPPGDELKNVRMDLGWIVTRTGWGPDHTVLSFRSGGPMNHEHADRNSFILKARGERLLTERFGAAYRPDDPRWLLRLPIAHNSILVDGRGHQYHNGEEGTNASQASAEITQYEDQGDVVFWSSDATPAYSLVDDRITLVRRSVIFAKPDVVILIDEIGANDDVGAQILFHPDNRDGAAEIEIFTGGEFAIRRPKATLRGRCYSNQPVVLSRLRLDLPSEHGVFPYLEARTEPSSSVKVLTAFEVGTDHVVEVSAIEDGWRIHLDRQALAVVRLSGGSPTIKTSKS
jgi:hypothetical protein